MWSHWLRKQFRPAEKKARRNFRPFVELLEDRRLLATFTVTNTADDGDAFPRTPGSFRQAIWDALATPEQDTILFNIPDGGVVVRTIRPLSPLTSIGAGGAIIDGTSQSGYSGTPLIELDGSLAGTSINAYGLTLFSGPFTLKGLIINRFNRGGIRATSQTGNTTIQGCWIGLDSTGMASAGNGVAGIEVTGSNTLIGGSGAGQGNVISGNVQQGILFTPSIAAGVGCAVEGNLIGLNVAGTAAVPNGTNIPTTSGRAAIAIAVPNVRIGGTTPGAGNVISGNAVGGISAGYGGAGTPIVIQGNIVGLNPAGTLAIPNNGNGVELGVGVQTLGGTVPGARNVISGNTQAGVLVTANNSMVQGNYVGTNAAGTAALGNGIAGIQVGVGSTTTGAVIGGTDPAARNLVSGNLGPGIHVGQNSGGNTVQGNWVGLNAAGTAAVPNVVGVRISGLNHTLGGAAAGAGNIISGNTGAGVLVDTLIATTTSHILGNRIGTTPDGLAALPNTGEGISINGRNHRIGGTAPGEANVIAFNGGAGVFVSHVLVNGNAIRGNSIHSNGGLGIDLAPVGVTPNDNSDGDAGPNNLQNFPLPFSVTPTAVTGTLNSTQLTTYTLDFYASATADLSGHGEGPVHVGSTTVTTDGEGRVLFTAPLSVVVPVGQFLTATATDPANNTSEFSPVVAVTSTGRPVVSDLFDQTILEDSSISLIFHVGDPDTPATSLTVTASSSNPTLTPAGSFILGGSGMDRTLTVTPAANQAGTATITITVSDGVLTSTDIFLLTVTTVNDLPVLVNNTGLNVTSGATLVVTSSHLLATDSDNTAAQLVYSLRTLPVSGALQLNGVGLVVGGTFTQQDILDGRVRYVHNGSGTTTDSFTFDLSDRFPRVEFISRDPMGGMGNGGSDFEPTISATGRYVVFWSASSNLVPNDTNNLADTFLFDRQIGQMERISIGLGGAQPNGASGGGNTWRIVDVSDDGRYVAFASRAANLVAGDTNAAIDIFLRDRQAGTTAIVSVSSAGTLGNGDASEVAMSADGNVIAFVSNASNLTPNPDSAGDDVFVHDRRSGRTTRVSRSTTGGAPSAHSDEIALSADGRYLVFSSGANNLVSGDTNGVTDIFLYDILNGTLTRVSVDSSGAQATGNSTHPAISGDGRFVVFESTATNLVPDDTNNRTDLFLRDLQTGTTTRIPAEGGAQPVWNSVRASISYDGRYVAFQYGASDQQPGRQEDVMLYDRLTDQTVEASVNGSGVSANGDSERAAISGDGQYIAFPSHAGNLVPGIPGNTFAHIFVAKTGIVTANVNVTITPSQGLRVTTFTPTASGFTVAFSQAIDSTVINLYDTQAGGLGVPDVAVMDGTMNPVRGSLVIAPDGRSITFIRTGGVLTPGTYMVTLRSASNGFKTAAGGELLDGNGDGTSGDDYTNTITATSAVAVSIPDFMRGPGQAIHVPATSTGLPLRLSDSTGVTEVMLTLRYNPNLLIITGATALPAGSNVTLDTSTPGAAILHFTDTTPSAGITDFVRLTASVPESAGLLYTQKQLLDLTSLSINGGAIAALDDDGLHVNAYLGDTTGNAGYSSTDATRTSRVVVGLDSGFSAYQLADPVIIADISGNGLLTSTDALRILQESIGQDRTEIPALPPSPPTIVVSGPDPLLSIPRRFRARPGSLVKVPVNLDRSEGLDSADLALGFDPGLLEVVEVRRGSLTGDFDLFAVNVDQEAGTIRVGLGRSAGPIQDLGNGSILMITFRVRTDAPAGRAIINLRQSIGGTTTQLNEGGLDLQPDPSNEAGDVLDGAITVQGQPVKWAATDLIFAASPIDSLNLRWEVMNAFFHRVWQHDTAPPKRRRG